MQQRISTLEEYKKQMIIITEYINNHLDVPIDLAKLSEISCFSPYHFHRIIRAFLGEPIGSYIVRIRLETAARLIRYTDLPVSDIAYRVGYDAPTSLSKAFKKQYGISPLEYRTQKDYLIIDTEKKDIHLKIKSPKILDILTKQVIFIKLIGKYESLDFGGAWQHLWQFVKEQKLFSAGIEHLAVYHDDPKVTEMDKLRTDLCLTIIKEVKPQGSIGVKEIKGGKFAMFLYEGPYSNLDAVYNEIYANLLPKNGLRLRDYHGYEKYLNHPDRTDPEKLKTEIYVPIEENNS